MAKSDSMDDLFGDVPKPRATRTPAAPVVIYRQYATVAVSEPVMSTYSFGVPDDLAGKLRIGSLVEVGFAGRTARGCVVELTDSLPQGISPARLKPVIRVITPEFAIPGDIVQLALWMADYYLSPPGDALNCASFIGLNDISEKTLLSYCLAPDWEIRAGERKLTVKQRAVVETLAAQENTPMGAAELGELANVGRSVIMKLLEYGVLCEIESVSDRGDDYGAAPQRDKPLAFNFRQQEAFETIVRQIETREPAVFLIHGVTGSGKTEVYLQAIASALDAGGDAIVLVPEISLTPQAVDRFRSRFGSVVGVYHSKLTLGQKFDLWRRVESGSCRIMVGARSALFTPFRNLRIIVIDEEHETSYKQDSSPRYHARELAIERSRRCGASVILGSATPSVESFYRAKCGEFRLLSLPDRIDERPMPEVRLIDMTREARDERNPGIFSGALEAAMNEALSRGEQVLLFLNRRGFFNFVVCMSCNSVVRCEHCDVSMTHHKFRDRLICHFCNRETQIPAICPDCGHNELSLIGLGTQRVEDEVKKRYPDKQVIRMDLDTTRQRTAFMDAWRRIESGEIDIILGTQMIAKGFHLENVTVVGVPLADVSLFQPDFRSAERAFSLLTQVAGRAGRGDKPGVVML
ncbi:MAG: primosomal protein N', partial [Candidatus Sumerlaeaceae bacterium]|nr:primosomal protein N' [Candidatus Sumerlaeaceae bacterium]